MVPAAPALACTAPRVVPDTVCTGLPYQAAVSPVKPVAPGYLLGLLKRFQSILLPVGSGIELSRYTRGA